MSYVLALQAVVELLAEAKEIHEIDHHLRRTCTFCDSNGNENIWPELPLHLRLGSGKTFFPTNLTRIGLAFYQDTAPESLSPRVDASLEGRRHVCPDVHMIKVDHVRYRY
jgi:hypothetical protein